MDESRAIIERAVGGALDAVGAPLPDYGQDEAGERERLKAIKLLRAELRAQEYTARSSIRAARERRQQAAAEQRLSPPGTGQPA